MTQKKERKKGGEKKKQTVTQTCRSQVTVTGLRSRSQVRWKTQVRSGLRSGVPGKTQVSEGEFRIEFFVGKKLFF
jgi:hypothetical protein